MDEGGAEGRISPFQLPSFTRRTFLAVAAAGLLAACGGSPRYPAPDTPQGKLYYGAAMPPQHLGSFEQEVGSRLSCHRTFFSAGGEGDLVAQARADVQLGRVPLVSIKPAGSWAEAARDDAWLDSLVGPLSDIPAPVFLIIHHEPEDDAARFGSPDDFIAMQRAALARAEGAGSNVTVVPVLSAWSFAERAGRSPAEWNVDDAPVYGLDLYNPWSSTNGKDWVPFADRLSVAEDQAGGRPLLVGEYGCRTDPALPGRAAAWMQDAFASALSGGVIAMAYFNSYRNSRDGTWELDLETRPVFAELLQSQQVARI